MAIRYAVVSQMCIQGVSMVTRGVVSCVSMTTKRVGGCVSMPTGNYALMRKSGSTEASLAERKACMEKRRVCRLAHSRSWSRNNTSHYIHQVLEQKQHISLHTRGPGAETTHLITHSRSWSRNNTSHYTLQVPGHKQHIILHT